jgi:hypothetical protein
VDFDVTWRFFSASTSPSGCSWTFQSPALASNSKTSPSTPLCSGFCWSEWSLTRAPTKGAVSSIDMRSAACSSCSSSSASGGSLWPARFVSTLPLSTSIALDGDAARPLHNPSTAFAGLFCAGNLRGKLINR